MVWVKTHFMKIDGYDKSRENGRRWFSFTIDELFKKDYIVEEYLRKLKTKSKIAKFVIEEFDYPYFIFSPTDVHCLFWFWKIWKCIKDDYWQSAGESLLTHKYGWRGYGDCEDTSILFTTLMNYAFGNDAYTMFGVVYDRKTGKMLGGHGWAIFKDERGVWRLYESTLDKAPDYPNGYPPINPNDREFVIGNIKYKAFWKFNAFEFYDWSYHSFSLREYSSVRKYGREEKKKIKSLRLEWKSLNMMNALHGGDENG